MGYNIVNSYSFEIKGKFAYYDAYVRSDIRLDSELKGFFIITWQEYITNL